MFSIYFDIENNIFVPIDDRVFYEKNFSALTNLRLVEGDIEAEDLKEKITKYNWKGQRLKNDLTNKATADKRLAKAEYSQYLYGGANTDKYVLDPYEFIAGTELPSIMYQPLKTVFYSKLSVSKWFTNYFRMVLAVNNINSDATRDGIEASIKEAVAVITKQTGKSVKYNIYSGLYDIANTALFVPLDLIDTMDKIVKTLGFEGVTKRPKVLNDPVE